MLMNKSARQKAIVAKRLQHNQGFHSVEQEIVVWPPSPFDKGNNMLPENSLKSVKYATILSKSLQQ